MQKFRGNHAVYVSKAFRKTMKRWLNLEATYVTKNWRNFSKLIESKTNILAGNTKENGKRFFNKLYPYFVNYKKHKTVSIRKNSSKITHSEVSEVIFNHTKESEQTYFFRKYNFIIKNYTHVIYRNKV